MTRGGGATREPKGDETVIYSHYGNVIEVTGYCGRHKVKGFPAPIVLVKARRQEDRAERYYFAHSLRADDGINVVHAAIDDAPEITLGKADLAKAIEQAM